MPDLRAYAREAAARSGCDPDLFVRQIQQESGFNPTVVNPASGATGIAQIIKRWHPDVDPLDPIASLDYAASWMARLHDQYGTYKMALAAYNWGPGNVAGWDGRRETLPAETRHYLDVILGEGWPEPSTNGADRVNLAGREGRPAGAAEGRSGASAAAALHLRVARVAPNPLNMRAEPSLTAAPVGQFPEGTLLVPLGPAREADEITWVKVRAATGAEGWMSAKYLDLVAAVPTGEPGLGASGPVAAPAQVPAPTRFRVTESGVRMRERPGTGANVAILTTLNADALVDDDGADTERADGREWRRVRAGGRTGWIATEFLAAAGRAERAAAPSGPVAAPAQVPAPTKYRLTESGVRLRERPGTGQDATVLTTLTSGTVVDDDGAATVNAAGREWRRVRAGGRTGWVATEFLTAAGSGRAGGRAGISFNADTPTELQRQPWTCSIRSTMWLLKSIGKDVTPEEAQDAMAPRYCNEEFGLLDASGAGIVEVLRDTWGVSAFNRNPVSFDEVAGWAGRCPVAIGGRNWGGPGFGHWSAVRGVNEAGELMLANPGGTGPRFGQQTLNSEQWDRMGSFSAVVVPVE